MDRLPLNKDTEGVVMGAEFFRFLGPEFFFSKNNQKEHSPSSASASSGPWVCVFFCFFVCLFFCWYLCS